MKERPILFSSPMIRAILAGRKSQTRRAVKLGFTDWQRDHSLAMMVTGSDGMPCFTDAKAEPSPAMMAMLRSTPGKPCPYGAAGDALWVRETWAYSLECNGKDHDEETLPIQYRADGDDVVDCGRWRPSIHMPRWASRITLPVTAIRVERLQEISEADARAEGVTPCARCRGTGIDPVRVGGVDPDWCSECGGTAQGLTHRDAYSELWDVINGRGAWERNPWVWVVAFGPAQIGGAK